MKEKQVSLILYCICTTGLIASIILQSRSFGLGFLFCFGLHLFYFIPNYNKRLNLIGLLAFLLLFITSFYLKHDSSLGRLFIYKISLQIWQGNPTGIGFGAFKTVYMQYQANYFKNGHYAQKELLLADNTWFAFNDYFQIIIENGIVGYGIVICYFGLIIKFCKGYFYSKKRPLMFGIALTACLTISIAAAFNHIYERQWCQAILIISLITLLFYTRQKFLIWQWPIIVVSVIVIILTTHQIFKTSILNRIAYDKFKESDNLERAGFKTESLKLLNSLYQKLNNDPEYLDRYDKQLYYLGNFTRAIIILNKAANIRSYSYDYVLLGDCYREIGDYKKAENCYLKAIWMVPNRFRSRYALYELYKFTRQTAKRVAVAKDIINLPVKIPSIWIAHLKFEMQNDKG